MSNGVVLKAFELALARDPQSHGGQVMKITLVNVSDYIGAS